MLVEATDGNEQTLAEGLSPSLLSLASGPFALATPWVVSLETGKPLGRVAGRPLAIAPNGRVLTAQGPEVDASQLATGPLGWRAPTPATGPY